MSSPISLRAAGLSATVSMLVFASSSSPVHAAPTAAQQVCGDWVQVAPPAGATLAVTEVQAASANDAWAFAYSLGLVRWDGTTWNQVVIPDYFGNYPTVWASDFGLVGPSHLFLAGAGDTGPFSNDQILKIWDGADWSDWHSLTLQPDIMGWPRNGSANAVAGAAIDDVWILGVASGLGTGVGGPPILTVHWDGSDLTEFITPGIGNYHNAIEDGVAIATDDVWAVGDSRNTGGNDPYSHGATYHWDGSSWSPIPNPSQAIPSTHLYAVAAIASDDVWAAGSNGVEPLFMHWDGSDWTIVPAPATTGTIQGLAAIASDDVWAVDSAAQVPVIGKYYHWDGVAWSIVMPPSIPGATNISRHGGMAAVGTCDVWAVGSIDYGSGVGPFIERLDASSTGGPSTYCVASANSAGIGAQMSAAGSVSIASNTFALVANGAPPSVNGLFFYGPDQLQVPFGDGFLCVGGTVQRLQGVVTDAGGHALHPLDFSLPPVGSGANAILPGSTWNFQFWYRDPAAMGAGFNLSDGLNVQFLP